LMGAAMVKFSLGVKTVSSRLENVPLAVECGKRG